MKRFFDAHSHDTSADQDVCTMINLYQDFTQAERINPCSIGLHPWHLSTSVRDMGVLTEYAAHPNVWAIGECGLDKLCDTPWELQISVFQQQIDLANQVQKPLIIHCVRAFSEAIKMLQSARVPVIFHGFQKNPTLAAELLQHGFYLSFGVALTKGQIHAIDSISKVPADRFFLETDISDITIQEIYQAAAQFRKITVDELVHQIHRNYDVVFTRHTG